VRRQTSRVDDNHHEIVRVLREVGATVHDGAAIGDGFPDLIVGFRGINYLIEIKDGSKIPSRRRLTPAQEKFHSTWRGQATTVTNELEALSAIGVI
jgi:hypothetical protein